MLVCRSWRNRKKLEPLGIDLESDKAKKIRPRKTDDQKLLEKAYEKAILFHNKVHERNSNEGHASDLLSEESSEESD